MTSSAPSSLRRLITAALSVAAIALGTAATAIAEPEWDIDAYDKCMAKTVRDPATCCLLSGGNVGDKDPNVCTAPAAVQQGAAVEGTGPTRQPPMGDLPTLVPDGPALMPDQTVG
ncbi:MAG: hypothetical protein WAL26_23405 [Mycobacterium sp.]